MGDRCLERMSRIEGAKESEHPAGHRLTRFAGVPRHRLPFHLVARIDTRRAATVVAGPTITMVRVFTGWKPKLVRRAPWVVE